MASPKDIVCTASPQNNLIEVSLWWLQPPRLVLDTQVSKYPGRALRIVETVDIFKFFLSAIPFVSFVRRRE